MSEQVRRMINQGMKQIVAEEEAKRRAADEHFANIAIKPLEISRECLGEFTDFLVEALTILDVSRELLEVIEGWLDEHDA